MGAARDEDCGKALMSAVPLASVVIPAYNEGRVIGRCLTSLGVISDFRVVVCPNGCRDDTASRARSLGAGVFELKQPSKVAALNAGDAACQDIFPRVYLDADIELSSGALRALICVLAEASRPTVAMPRLVFDTAGSSWIVRSFYRAYTQLPYVAENLVGSGCYAVNSAGRARWGQFPDVVADDLYVQGLFSASERIVLNDVYCVARTPRNLSSLMKVRTRSYQGNRELWSTHQLGSMKGSTSRTIKTLMRSGIRRPWKLLDLGVYVAVTIAARGRALGRREKTTWLTDESSR
jgi:glycosyltransferase involved in cell wall biosynthesis